MNRQWVRFCFVVVAFVLFVWLPASAQTLDPKLTKACTQAFAGQCFHAGKSDLDLSQILSEFDAEIYCDSRNLFCSASECKLRVKVLANLFPSSENGDPCLFCNNPPDEFDLPGCHETQSLDTTGVLFAQNLCPYKGPGRG